MRVRLDGMGRKLNLQVTNCTCGRLFQVCDGLLLCRGFSLPKRSTLCVQGATFHSLTHLLAHSVARSLNSIPRLFRNLLLDIQRFCVICSSSGCTTSWKMMQNLLTLAVLALLASQVRAKAVFAHFMVTSLHLCLQARHNLYHSIRTAANTVCLGWQHKGLY